MKKWMVLALVLPLSACTLTAAPEQETVAAYDLTDADLDGVISARDNCLESVSNAEVDNDGCGDGAFSVLKQDIIILFAHDSSVISPSYQGEINKMASFMAENPDLNLLLEGHASKVGTPTYNLALSKRRATRVKNALAAAGIDNHRLEIIGYGETQPVLMAEGEDVDMAAENRRVVGALATQHHGVTLRWNVYNFNRDN
ncbi:MAG: OmpA family protein [Oceanisphaera sp.]